MAARKFPLTRIVKHLLILIRKSVHIKDFLERAIFKEQSAGNREKAVLSDVEQRSVSHKLYYENIQTMQDFLGDP